MPPLQAYACLRHTSACAPRNGNIGSRSGNDGIGKGGFPDCVRRSILPHPAYPGTPGEVWSIYLTGRSGVRHVNCSFDM